jgi:hypothetical protein
MSPLPDLSGSFSTPAADNPTAAMMEAVGEALDEAIAGWTYT